MGKKEIHAGLWWESLKVGYYVEDAGLYGMVLLKWMLNMMERREGVTE
jgi:hypothetical protein